MTWYDLYYTDAQGLYAKLVVPALFLIYRLALERRGRDATRDGAFVSAYAWIFAIETALDPIVTGPLVRALGWADSFGGTGAMLLFVLLGDLRVYLLVFHLARPSASVGASTARAALAALAVPTAAWLGSGALEWSAGPQPGQTLWLIHELLFATVVGVLALRWLPGRGLAPPLLRFLRAVCAYTAGYYLLWALADVLILSGVDAGWALRIAPNQLYYAFFVPFAYFRFLSAR